MRDHRWAASALALTLAVLPGCGDGDTGPSDPGPPEPQTFTLTVVEGNGQRGFAYAVLGYPVVVELKLGDEPVSGEPIDFSVALGSAFISRTSAVTDDDGRAAVAVRLGGDPGPVWIRAETPELSTQTVQATLEVLRVRATLLNPDVGLAYDLEVDVPRRRAYLTRHQESKVEAFSIETGAELWTLPVDGTPYGSSLSVDGDELFVALAGSGTVGAIDLETLEIESIPVADATGHSTTWDVLETTPGALFVSANTTAAPAYIVKIDRSDPTNAVRVANEEVIRGEPSFLQSVDGTALFVSEEFSPYELYRLDLTRPDAPIETESRDVGKAWWMSMDRGGTRIYLGGDQVVDAESFAQIGSLPGGAKVTSRDDSIVFVFNDNGFRAYETAGFRWVGDVDLPTSHHDVRLVVIPGTDRVVMHDYTSGELWLLELIV